MGVLLLADEDSPLIAVNEQGRSPFVLICEHASRLLPKRLGTLGLPESDLARHIAWDIGALGLARELSVMLTRPAIG